MYTTKDITKDITKDTTMFIYLVKGTRTGYFTYSDFVCIAPSEEVARRMHPNGCSYFDGKQWVNEDGHPTSDNSWDKTPDTVQVIEIGVCVNPEFFDGPPQVISVSYRS